MNASLLRLRTGAAPTVVAGYVALQPRRFMIAPAAVGCKRLLGSRSSATLPT